MYSCEDQGSVIGNEGGSFKVFDNRQNNLHPFTGRCIFFKFVLWTLCYSSEEEELGDEEFEEIEANEDKFPLAPMGFLTPGSAHARPSAQPPINTSGNFPAHMSAESPSNIFPNPSEVISEVSEP